MTYLWAVIGAGPAGIAAIGKLLDLGIASDDIIWIDPKFSVGDFGTIWQNVPSNTKVSLFLKFLNASSAFGYPTCPQDFSINHAEQDKTCRLGLMAEPLQWITNQLKNRIHAVQDMAESLSLNHNTWKIKLRKSHIQAKNVILAIGAEPKNLTYPGPSIIPLADALNQERLAKHINKDDTIAVFGSSHSAMLILRNLVESKIKKIINFYRSPLRYAVYLQDWILFDDTGLKGPTAEWARANIDGARPVNLERVYVTEEKIEHHLPYCNKTIYAVGFERRTLPVIEDVGEFSYIEQCGIIAPGLFGLGIAFPEAKYNPFGMLEYRVGLWKFMDYLNTIMPIWLKYFP